MPSSTGSWKLDGMDMELDEQVRAAEPDGKASRIQDAPERDGLLSGQISGNGGVTSSGGAAEAPDSLTNTSAPAETGPMCRVKREMNEVVCKKVRLWMVIVFILVVIAAVITISLLVCSAIHEDEDETFDASLFTAPLYFNGSFQLPNVVFREELSAGDSQALAGQLEEKLAHLFRSSPALGRYFSAAEINAFRNASAVADYQLTFVMPEDEQDELRTFTLSREMVYNVFRQFLYDQDSDPSELVYIEPRSLLVL